MSSPPPSGAKPEAGGLVTAIRSASSAIYELVAAGLDASVATAWINKVVADTQRTRARHAREVNAIIAKLSDISRETVRKFEILQNTCSEEMLQKLEAGEMRINYAYRLVTGGDHGKCGLFVKIPEGLRRRLREESLDRGITMSELVTEHLTQIFGEPAL